MSHVSRIKPSQIVDTAAALRILTLLTGRIAGAPPTIFVASPPLPRIGQFSPETHVHDSWEIKFAVKRDLCVRFPGFDVTVMAPGCCLIAPGTPHETSHPDDVERTGLAFIACYDGQRFDMGPVTRHSSSGRLELSSSQVAALQTELGGDFDAFLRRLTRDLTPWGRPTPSAQSRAPLDRFLHALMHVIALGSATPPGRIPPLEVVTRAEAYLQRRYFDPELTVTDVANAVDRTPTHLATLFRRHRGQSVRGRLVAIRLARAEAFLRSGRYSVKEVSVLTGWASPAYFSNCFMKNAGHRPSRML